MKEVSIDLIKIQRVHSGVPLTDANADRETAPEQLPNAAAEGTELTHGIIKCRLCIVDTNIVKTTTVGSSNMEELAKTG